MKVFDQIDPLKVERRKWHLWLLALTVILVLTVGMALLMYPTVFSHPVVLTGATQRKAFFDGIPACGRYSSAPLNWCDRIEVNAQPCCDVRSFYSLR